MRPAFAVALAAGCIYPALSTAHEAPSGWNYDASCCSNHDCAPETAEVKATPFGWLVTATGETIPYSDYRIRMSGDGEFHRCHAPSHPSFTRCLYVPGMGF